MLSLKSLGLPAAALLLAACASAPAPDYSGNHPANPGAAPAPAATQRSALADYRSSQPAPPPATSPEPAGEAPGKQKEDPHAGHH